LSLRLLPVRALASRLRSFASRIVAASRVALSLSLYKPSLKLHFGWQESKRF